MNIEKLLSYPIKSCGGIEFRLLNLVPSGPTWDRRYVLVDANGVFLSQRTFPRMSLISTGIGHSVTEGAVIWVKAPGMGERHAIRLLQGKHADAPGSHMITIRIHKDTCKGLDLGDEHAEWFSKFLGTSCRLVKQMSSVPRIRDSSALERQLEVSFADGYPLLITTTDSLRDLNLRISEKGGEPVPMDRFRPNIVLRGCEPYAEDSWRGLRIGGVELLAANKCVRCVITTTDQHTGDRGKEPLRTLATYRKNAQNGIEFGRNFAIIEPGVIEVGQEVEILT